MNNERQIILDYARTRHLLIEDPHAPIQELLTEITRQQPATKVYYYKNHIGALDENAPQAVYWQRRQDQTRLQQIFHRLQLAAEEHRWNLYDLGLASAIATVAAIYGTATAERLWPRDRQQMTANILQIPWQQIAPPHTGRRQRRNECTEYSGQELTPSKPDTTAEEPSPYGKKLHSTSLNSKKPDSNQPTTKLTFTSATPPEANTTPPSKVEATST